MKLLDHFKHSGPNKKHVCIGFEYVGDNFFTLINYSEYKVLEVSLGIECLICEKGVQGFAQRNEGEKGNVGLSVYSKYLYTSSVTTFLFWGDSTFVSVVTWS